MADFAITNEKIWPTDADVGAVDGDGDGLFELNLASWLAKAGQANFVVSGLTLPASDANLVVDVALGVAVIDGRLVTVPAVTPITVGDNTTSYLYLRLDKTALKATAATFEVNTTGTAPADSVAIAILLSAAGAISLITDVRVVKPSYTGNNRTTVISTSGAGTFVARTNYVILEMIGGGGGGGGSAAASGGGGGGGGGGAYVKREYATIPGKRYAVNVGAAGAAGASAGTGGDGGKTWFDADAEGSRANGGTGGAGGASGAGGAGGTGTTDAAAFKIPGSAGGSKSGTTGGAAGIAGGFYQPTPVYGGGGIGTTSIFAAVGNVGLQGLLIIHD